MGVTTEAWGGWYEQDGAKESIAKFTLLITDGLKLSGSGVDDLGSWTWKGQTDSSNQKLVLEKQYVGGIPHNGIVTYTGTRAVSAGVDVIDGTWSIGSDSGAFHLDKIPHALEETYTGYYEQDGTQHTVSTVLYTTTDNKLFGSGSDENGEFTWTGEIDPTTGAVKLQKLYLDSTTAIEYNGTKSFQNGRNVIQGLWGDASANNKFFLGVEGTPYSGPWTGYYVQGGEQHAGTNFTLEVTGSSYTGHGYDDVGEFIWEGEISGKDQVVLRKKYVNANGTPSESADVVYTGTISFQDGKQVIEGTWSVPPSAAPGTEAFHFELPEPSTEERPFDIPVSIRSTGTPNAYLRLDGGAGVVNLQVGRRTYERFQLVSQGEVSGGEQVYAIKSLLFNQYVHLDPTVSDAQKPTGDNATFYPKGVGRTFPVKAVDELSKFTVQVNDDKDGFTSHSLKLLNSGNPALPKLFLRLNAEKLTDASAGSGEVNAQTYVGPYERLVIEPFPY